MKTERLRNTMKFICSSSLNPWLPINTAASEGIVSFQPFGLLNDWLVYVLQLKNSVAMSSMTLNENWDQRSVKAGTTKDVASWSVAVLVKSLIKSVMRCLSVPSLEMFNPNMIWVCWLSVTTNRGPPKSDSGFRVTKIVKSEKVSEKSGGKITKARRPMLVFPSKW